MYQFDIFAKEKIRHGSLERSDKKSILKEFGKRIIFPEQVHGKEIYFCKENESLPTGRKEKIKGVDGLITKQKNQILVVKTADCIPLFLYDKEKIGLVHTGLKGLAKGIIFEVIKKGNFKIKNLLVGIGPHIKKECYYLRGSHKKYAEQFNEYAYKKNNRFHLSIGELAKDQLLKAGVLKENIEDCKICTYCNNRFLSARKQGKNFNCFLSFIRLR